MSRTIRYNTQSDSKPRVKQDKFAGLKRKYADFLMIDLWYEELPITRKSARKIRI